MILLQSLGENKLYQRGHFNLEKQHFDKQIIWFLSWWTSVWRVAVKRCWYTKSILGWQPSLNYGDNKTITNTLFMGEDGWCSSTSVTVFWSLPKTKTSAINFSAITSQQFKYTISEAKHHVIWDKCTQTFLWSEQQI